MSQGSTQGKYLRWIEVSYDPKRPENIITELNGYKEDINFGCERGDPKNVWLIPMYSDAGGSGVTGYDIVIQGTQLLEYRNLAEGDGGQLRFLVPTVNPRVAEKIIDIRLLRSTRAVHNPPEGWDRMTKDINEGRSCGYLYLIYKVQAYRSPPIEAGLYTITNRQSRTVMDLQGGSPNSGTVIQSWAKTPSLANFFNQLWWIERVPGQDYYLIRNARSGTVMDLDGGGSVDRTRIHGWVFNRSDPQHWFINGDGKEGYSLFNVYGGLTPDVKEGCPTNGIPVLGYKSHGAFNQLWFLDRVSQTPEEVGVLLKNSPFVGVDFHRYPDHIAYVNCPEAVIREIWISKGLGGDKWRPSSYDFNEYAKTMQGAVCEWMCANLRIPGLGILFGTMYGRNNKGENHAFNWYTNDKLDKIAIFDPQSGNVSERIGYEAFFGAY